MIPFNIPYKPKEFINEFKKIKNCFGNDGKYTKLSEDFLSKKYNSKKVILTHSCTGALEICSLLLNLQKDDEIILPSFTFVSVANAFALRNAKLKFLDVEKNTLNLKYDDIKNSATKKTKAIIIVHYAGYSEEIDKISKFAKKNNITLIEDCAHSIFTKFNGKLLGTFGDLSTLSFHETKNIHCGTGGALIINNKKYIEKAEIISNKGTDRHLFNKKKVLKYNWVNLGSSYKINEINSTFLYYCIKDFKKIKKARLNLWNFYYQSLKFLDRKNLIYLPKYNFKRNENSTHMFYFLVKPKVRKSLLKHLNKYKIGATFHYLPLCISPFYRKKNRFYNKVSITSSKELIRLPIYYDLKKEEQKYVIEKIIEFFNK